MNNFFSKNHSQAGIKALAIVLLFIMSCFNLALARTISESEARLVAKSFLQEKQIISASQEISLVRSAARRAPGINGAATAQSLYVYNAGDADAGYVIVSGDDRAMPVLGYSDHGHFDPANVAPALQEWVDFLTSEIESLGDVTLPAPVTQPLITARASISPMIKTQWDQNAPYNNRLKKTNDGNTAVTGCVATAMAQIMNYHKWPSKTTQAIPAYTTSTQSIYMPELAITTFDWSNMKNTYRGDNTGTSVTAVSTLMLYCAQALEMDFKNGVSSSGTYKMANVLPAYFNYANSAFFIERFAYSTTEWENKIYSELSAKRPVAYGGSKMEGGHSFVCDGYDGSTGMFHFNWGWSGSSDGYYLLSSLKPQYQGIGSAEGTEGYIRSQGIVVGITPNTGTIPNDATAMTISTLTASKVNFSRSSSSSSFTDVQLKARFSNNTGETRSFFGAWALYKDGKFVKYMYDNNNSSTYSTYNDLQHGWGGDRTYTLTFDASIEKGTYILYPMSQVKSTSNWTLCFGYKIFYVEATVSDYSLSLKVYGSGGTRRYSENSIQFNGSMKIGKPISIVANLNNTGTSMNDYIYLVVDNTVTTMSMACIQPGSSGNVTFNYLPTSTGSKTIKLSLNDDGSNPFATRSIVIQNMASANLSMTANILNTATVNSEKAIKGNSFTVMSDITNNNSSTFNEDVVVQLFRVINYQNGKYSGKVVKDITRTLTINGKDNSSQTFSFNGLMTGEQYWVRLNYYSAGQLTIARDTGVYRIVTGYATGDVNGDGKVDIEDVNAIINIILELKTRSYYKGNADVNNDNKVDVEDVNAVINICLQN
ncbi:MAG: C10 family peptidase [Muribaculaceae bacterium]|nr:C10 family peptidase [Muribaculaceae bacterium]